MTGVQTRAMYLAAYDISCPKRQLAALQLLRGHATGGQKSVYEVFLTQREKGDLLEDMNRILHGSDDRFFLLRLDPHARVYVLGTAQAPGLPGLFYVG